MTLRRVTFEVDTAKLFDMLAQLNGDWSHLGNRVAASLLADPDIADRIGMAVYGVTIAEAPNA